MQLKAELLSKSDQSSALILSAREKNNFDSVHELAGVKESAR